MSADRAVAQFVSFYWEVQIALLTLGLGAMFGFWLSLHVQRGINSALYRLREHARSRGRTGTTFGAGRF